MIAVDAGSGWVDRIQALAHKLLSSARFRRLAAAFPLTRPIARARASELFDLCAGFVYSQVLLACVRLDLFAMLANGPLSTADLAERLKLSTDATSRLLDAAVALRLLTRRSRGRYALGPLGATLVGNEPVLSMIEHHAMLYRDLDDPVKLLQQERASGELARYWSYATSTTPSALESPSVAGYSALMAASQPLVADQVLAAYSFGKHRCLLDVGGGDGSFLKAVGLQHPALELMLFDLPAVAARATATFAQAGLTARARVHGGSFLTDPLPQGADVISLVRVLHDHDDGFVLRILAAVRRVIPDDGVLLIAEPMAGTPGAQNVGDAYFGFYLLAMGSGRARTPARLCEMLAQTGFGDTRLVPTHVPLQARLLLARPLLPSGKER